MAGALWKKLPPGGRTMISRMTNPTFTVSVAGIITDIGGRVLLLNHVLRPSSGWGLPGGFIGRSEMPAAAFKREILEETGIGMTDITIYRASTLKRHVEILFTAGTVDEPRALSREIYEFGWFQADELPVEMNIAQQRVIREVLGHGV